MSLRVRPKMLAGIVVVLVLLFAVVANAQLGGSAAGGVGEAQLGGGAGSTAVSVGEAQLGAPFVYGTDGPDTFSCSGLMRYILRTTGVDADAPWVPEEYLNRYAPVAYGDLQPGDIVIYPDWATMYAGNGMLLNANMLTGNVTETPMEYAGEPLGIARPY